MRREYVLIAASGFLAVSAAAAHAAPSHDQAKLDSDLRDHVTPLLKQFCYECHGDGASAGELELDKYKNTQELRAAKEKFQKVIRYVRGHTMPSPEATTQPTQPQRDALVKALSRQLYDIDPNRPDPGRVTLRRLN